MANFTEIKTLTSNISNDGGLGPRATTNDGEKAFWIADTGTDVYQWDPATNTETLLFDNADVVAIDANAGATFSPVVLEWMGPRAGALFVGTTYATGGGAIWRYDLDDGAITLDLQVSLDSPTTASFRFFHLGTELIAGTNELSPANVYQFQYKKTAYSSWITIPQVVGYETHLTPPLIGINIDATLASVLDPPFYVRASINGGPSVADSPLLLQWTGSSWTVAQINTFGSPGIGWGLGPVHYWTDYPTPGGGPFGTGTYTDDFITTTATGGAAVKGVKTMNMPFMVGYTAANWTQLDSNNDFVNWCTGPAHSYGVSDGPIMWLAEDGEVYLFATPSNDDWRVYQLTSTDST